jgi:hypothetical protein
VPAAGSYTVLVRYEAAYRYTSPFRLEVAQGGVMKLSRVYGKRSSLKIWAFSDGRNSPER